MKKVSIALLALFGFFSTALAATLINLTYQVTGTLPHGNGGTDVTSPGASGNVLTSNGTVWQSIAGGTVTGSGTNPKIAIWSSSSAVGNIGTPSNCSAGQVFGGIDANGASQSCLTPGGTITTAFIYGGDASDGTVDFDGTNTFTNFATTTGAAPNLVYTLTRDVFGDNITVESGKTVKTANMILIGSLSITINGTLDNSGNNGTVSQSGGTDTTNTATAGTVPLPTPGAIITNANGGAGGSNGGIGANCANSVFTTARSATAWTGGTGGTGAVPGNAGGNNGTTGTFTTTNAPINTITRGLNLMPGNGTTTPNYLNTPYCIYNGLGGGGGGGTGGSSGGGGGAGGGGGGCGGWIVLSSPSITIGGAGLIKSNGGTGGGGSNGANAVGAGARGGGGGGAGGAGGNGGVVVLIYHTLSNSGSITETAGNGGNFGTGGNGINGGTNGSPGQAGPNGANGTTIQVTQ
jgi:hypothetical protein